jgi:hypothetical protein
MKIHDLPKPGKFYQIRYGTRHLQRLDRVIIFSIEKGLNEPLYAGYCYEKEVWEYFTESQLV